MDLSQKIKQAEGNKAYQAQNVPPFTPGKSTTAAGEEKNSVIDKIVKDSNKIASEEMTGLLATVIKERIFNGVNVAKTPSSPPVSQQT